MSLPITAAQLRELVEAMTPERAKAVLLAALALDDGGPDVSAQNNIRLRLALPDYTPELVAKRATLADLEAKITTWTPPKEDPT